jgi:hypothetical protein
MLLSLMRFVLPTPASSRAASKAPRGAFPRAADQGVVA